MIISHTHKFIFVKTRKTAGTSLQEALERICGPQDVATPTGISEETYQPRNYKGLVNPVPYLMAKPRQHRKRRIMKRTVTGERIFDHMHLSELLALSDSNKWSDYYKFCLERNPWDKTVSRYFWKYRGRPTRPDFETFVAHDKHVSDFDAYSLNGVIGVDYVGNYGDLPKSIAHISEAIGREIPLPMYRNANTRQKRDYRDMYTPETREKIGEVYAREIAAFGYNFG